MVDWETGLLWLVVALVAAFAGSPSDTQHARFAPVVNRLMDDASPTAIPRRAALDYWNTGPPAALSRPSA